VVGIEQYYEMLFHDPDILISKVHIYSVKVNQFFCRTNRNPKQIKS
jgi:hypothetical protein